MSRGISMALVAGLVACATPPTTDPADRASGGARAIVSASTWAALAADPTIAAVADDVALRCEPVDVGTDAAAPRCDAVVIAPDGARAPLGRTDLLAALRLDARRLVLLTSAGELRVRSDDGEQVIARDVRDPRVASDRRVLAFTQYVPGGGPGAAPGTLVALDLDRGARWLVTDDPLASSPFPVPGGEQVLYVSARTGLAALYLATPGQPPRQLTNVGHRTVDAGFVPVPGRELAWLDGRRAIFTATYGGVARLWALDLELGAAIDLGPGRRPRATAGGVEVIVDGAVRTLTATEVIAALEVTP
ncbi:MAG: hypothetical protein IPL61_28435 [Myxococcales bacterium]|nr:hypothetical protein [Myxococcales bacterium]